MKKNGQTWLFVAVVMTHLLCCRITEVLRLCGRDFRFSDKSVFVKSLKYGSDCKKPLMQTTLEVLKKWKKNGVKAVSDLSAAARLASNRWGIRDLIGN